MIYGYSRVSTTDQDAALQIDALNEYGVDSIYSDTISGSTNERPELDKLRRELKAGDTVVVWKLDRLFRSTIHALKELEAWAGENIVFHCLTQPISTADDSPAAKLMRTMLMAFGEFERDLIKERTAAGMAAAKKRGTHCGRPTKLNKARVELAQEKIVAGMAMKDVAALLNVSRPTLWRALKAA